MNDTNDTNDTNPSGAIVRLPDGKGRAPHNGSKVMTATLLTQIRSASKATKIGLDLPDPVKRYLLPDGTWNRTAISITARAFLGTVQARALDRAEGGPLTPWPDHLNTPHARLAIRIAMWGGSARRDFKRGTYDVAIGDTTIVPIPDDLASVAIKSRPSPSSVVDAMAKGDAVQALATYGAKWFGSSVRTGRTGFRTDAPAFDDSAL